jgi:hypothetical protein
MSQNAARPQRLGLRLCLRFSSAPAGGLSLHADGVHFWTLPKRLLPNNKFPFQHDFGSILAFIENNFGLGFIDQSGDKGYADQNTLDGANGNVPLSDFFQGAYRGFTSILPTNSQYNTNYFLNYYTLTGTQPQGPDGDAMD